RRTAGLQPRRFLTPNPPHSWPIARVNNWATIVFQIDSAGGGSPGLHRIRGLRVNGSTFARIVWLEAGPTGFARALCGGRAARLRPVGLRALGQGRDPARRAGREALQR